MPQRCSGLGHQMPRRRMTPGSRGTPQPAIGVERANGWSRRGTPQANYTTDLLANPIGGARQGFAYAGNLEASLDFNLERLLGLKGSGFFIAASWASGRDLSDRKIGNLFTVSQVFQGQSVRLAQVLPAGTAREEAKPGDRPSQHRRRLRHIGSF